MAGFSFLAAFSLVAVIGVNGSPFLSEPRTGVPVYNFSMPIDHFNSSDDRTYNNRYYVNDTYYKPGGPVFFFDYGESAFTADVAANWLAEQYESSNVMQLAKQYQGLAIGWEHRYFGLSLPFPLSFTNNTPTDPLTCSRSDDCTHNPIDAPGSYRYLTNEQALEDAIYFAHHFKLHNASEESSKYPIAPGHTPWIWIGGSYPGARAAWIRIRNPETFYASWSSSAPVEVRVDGSAYFDPIERALPQPCRADVIASVKHADEIMDGKHGRLALEKLKRLVYAASEAEYGLKTAYDMSGATSLTREDIGSKLIYGWTSDFQGYGPQATTDLMCKYMETYDPSPPRNTTSRELAILGNGGGGEPTKNGLAATYSPSIALDAYIYAYSRYARENGATSTSSSEGDDPVADTASWQWLVEKEFGIFEGSNPRNVSIVSHWYNYTAVRQKTGDVFDFNATKVFAHGPNLSKILKYGGWDMNPSNVMFTEGEFDPWRAFSVMSQEYSAGAPKRRVVQTVPVCNEGPGHGDIFGIVYNGTTHAQDLGGNLGDEMSPSARGLKLFTSALDSWLRCFEPH
jgi:hypothetical protein